MPKKINNNLYNTTLFKNNAKNDRDKGIIEKSTDATSTKTAKGTRIVKKGQDLDKNAFFKILSAELAHQNPMDAKDGTQYVSQMAQFTTLEQMANLNSMMKLTGASGFIGKAVLLRKFDDFGNQYAGIVKNVIKDGDNIALSVEYGPGKTEEFAMEDVINITDDLNENIKYNNNLLNAVALIGKKIEFYNEKEDGKDKLAEGTVKSVSRNGIGVALKVIINKDGKDKELDIPFEYVSKVEQPEK